MAPERLASEGRRVISPSSHHQLLRTNSVKDLVGRLSYDKSDLGRAPLLCLLRSRMRILAFPRVRYLSMLLGLRLKRFAISSFVKPIW
jgi:hypothetical protein